MIYEESYFKFSRFLIEYKYFKMFISTNKKIQNISEIIS